mmetsp:Transcript_25545/g.61533  ORF Transcript_25545/g.61533 Transcript_25545/m.61533 type:complete len:280 (-) Transcript_25545:310-1149(-)
MLCFSGFPSSSSSWLESRECSQHPSCCLSGCGRETQMLAGPCVAWARRAKALTWLTAGKNAASASLVQKSAGLSSATISEKDRIMREFLTDYKKENQGGQKNALKSIMNEARERRKNFQELTPRGKFSAHLKEVIRVLEEAKCFDISVYHTQRRLNCFDLMVVASGFSNRQVYVAVNNVGELAENLGIISKNDKAMRGKPVQIEEGWAHIDCRDMLVQVMVKEMREDSEWEVIFAHEKIPEHYLSDAISFEPKYPPEPEIAWFEEKDYTSEQDLSDKEA